MYNVSLVLRLNSGSNHADSDALIQTFIRQWPLQAEKHTKLECGPMPNVMAALPNIGGAICSTLQSLADAHY